MRQLIERVQTTHNEQLRLYSKLTLKTKALSPQQPSGHLAQIALEEANTNIQAGTILLGLLHDTHCLASKSKWQEIALRYCKNVVNDNDQATLEKELESNTRLRQYLEIEDEPTVKELLTHRIDEIRDRLETLKAQPRIHPILLGLTPHLEEQQLMHQDMACNLLYTIIELNAKLITISPTELNRITEAFVAGESCAADVDALYAELTSNARLLRGIRSHSKE